MKLKTLALPLRTVDYSNTSQIVTLFTREIGLVEAIAKGAHRPRNSFQGPFDLAVLREIVYVERRSPGLSILAESTVLEGYRSVRRSLPRYLAACLVIEILRGVVVSGDPARDLFDLAVETFEALDGCDEGRLGLWILSFELRALVLLGFLGAVDACVVCGRRWPGRKRGAFFSARAGGLLCAACRDAQRPPEAVPLSGGAVELVLELAKPAVRPPRVDLPTSAVQRLLGTIGETARFLLERPLVMLKYRAIWS